MNKLIIGAGYHDTPAGLQNHDPAKNYVGVRDLFPYWLMSIRRQYQHKLVIIADSGHKPPVTGPMFLGDHTIIPLTGNLGHAHDLLYHGFKNKFAGGPAVLMALAALAYVDQADLVYWESDCLCFGDVIGRLYREIGDGGIIFGRSKVMPCENSLFLLKHEFIPQFLATYMLSAPEHTPDQICEMKFRRWADQYLSQWRFHTMNGGRDRPLPVDDKEWYCQKITVDELAVLNERGLV
jgi:hypothetical protein